MTSTDDYSNTPASESPSRCSSKDSLDSMGHSLTDNISRPHAEQTALVLVRLILDDDTERITKASCFRAYKQYEHERKEMARVSAKLVKAKNQRNAMVGPLKRLTEEMQKIKQERKESPNVKSAEEENEIASLKSQLEESQHTLDALVEEAKMWEEEQSVLHLKITDMEKDFAMREEAFSQILEMKEVEFSAKDVRCDQQAVEIDQLTQKSKDMEAKSLDAVRIDMEVQSLEAVRVRELERLSATREEEVQLQLRACEAELREREARFGAFERELEESLAQAHCVAEELELELGSCHDQLQEREDQISLLDRLQERYPMARLNRSWKLLAPFYARLRRS
jgi:uncharacterized phage infection (PIP) family protein YhgE